MKTVPDVFGNFSRSSLLLREATRKGLIVATAVVACTVGLTFMSGFAQAQTPAVVEGTSAQGQALPGPARVDPGQVFVFDCIVGPRVGDISFGCSTPGSSANPRSVQCQTRNSASEPTSFRDQFGCQITRTFAGGVTFGFGGSMTDLRVAAGVRICTLIC